ncbi:MAG: Crp/Fnr family transcriptional regulator [Mogibacterium sp.]|nr:Crp/Fnr family transcriptional regulator [Mogibacterium sp.]
MFGILKDKPLFRGIPEEGIRHCITCSGAECMQYEKNEMIFTEGDTPLRLPVLVSGSVRLGRNSFDGRRSILADYDAPGEVFGYELLFLENHHYGIFAQAQARTRILHMPKKFLTQSCERNCGYHSQLISNMMLIMAEKSYGLNSRLEIMSCTTLRQKIAKMLLLNCGSEMTAPLVMGREEMADFLAVTRPSLSRELMRMQEEGLILIDGRRIRIGDPVRLEEVLNQG